MATTQELLWYGQIKELYNGAEAGKIDEETGKLYYFNKYLRFWTPTLKQGSKGWRVRAVIPSHLFLDAKLQGQGDKEELPASTFLFEMLTNCKNPWIGGD
jgi:hypothetical protein